MNATSTGDRATMTENSPEMPIGDRISFIEAIRHDMAQASMSEAQLGAALGVSQNAVNKWLKAGACPQYRLTPLRDFFSDRLGERSKLAKLRAEDLYQTAQVRQAHKAIQRAQHAAAPATGHITAMEGTTAKDELAFALLAAAAMRTDPDRFGVAVVALLSSKGETNWSPRLREAVANARRLGVEVWHCVDAVELAQRVAATPGTTYEIKRM